MQISNLFISSRQLEEGITKRCWNFNHLMQFPVLKQWWSIAKYPVGIDWFGWRGWEWSILGKCRKQWVFLGIQREHLYLPEWTIQQLEVESKVCFQCDKSFHLWSTTLAWTDYLLWARHLTLNLPLYSPAVVKAHLSKRKKLSGDLAKGSFSQASRFEEAALVLSTK